MPEENQTQEQLERANRMTLLGAGFSALGSIGAGVSARSTAFGRAAVYASNAASIRASLPFLKQAYGEEVSRSQEETAQLVSEQRAALAANGIVVDQDTALEAMLQTSSIGAREVVLLLQRSRQEVASRENEANQQDFQSSVAKREGKAALLKGLGGAAQTLLGAADTISQRTKKFRVEAGA